MSFNLRVNDIENADSYAIIAAFMSAVKLTSNMLRCSIPQQFWAYAAFQAAF